MNMTTISLKQLISSVESHLSASGYSKNTINRYRSCWRKILKRCSIYGIEEFSYKKCLSFIQEEYNIPSLENLKHHHVFYLRTIKVLNEYALYGKILKCHQKLGVQVVSEFADILSEFLNTGLESGLTKRTIEGKSIQLTSFLNYIEKIGIRKISLLEPEPILSYVKYISEKGYSTSTRSGILFTLRNFLSFLYEKSILLLPCSNYFLLFFLIKWSVFHLTIMKMNLRKYFHM
ncbi:site-specific integrase [Serpentinicella alkaliphila]|uniref:site-specific integrase n=1 Tax=Serpentinicella alkaliphila TaxID=1734049 RepID=UPI001BC8674B|nr:site-specific integrase [Serpentinicella alkaliphila]QUH26407.1 site-specific integrase [Serpentinicella alkaliphila]